MSERKAPEERPSRIPPHPLRRPAVAADEIDTGQRYAIATFGEVIGWSKLEIPFRAERRAAGVFQPVPAYWEVERVFALYDGEARVDAAAFQRYLKERDDLRLQVQDGEVVLDATVELIRKGRDRRYTIHVHVDDERYWRSHP